ncbi:MAG: hypothetical protein M3396_03375 [Actinomycetota bacterium]|nr:hypothetical protein [Actinomycetota bacterium]MDQ3575309.1 hypothetical protein [Actinomycetota bacterium]
MAEGAATDERVVLGRKDDSTWVGFQWTGQEPEELTDPDEAEAMGAVWEEDELVTYDLPALFRQAKQSGDYWLEDND